MRTPIAPTFSAPSHAPESAFIARAFQAEIGGRANHDFFEIAHVFVHITAIGLQVDDRVADYLAGPVIGDVAPAARLVQLDLTGGEQLGRGEQMRPRRIGFDAKRDDVGMLEQEKEIGHVPGPPLLDERTLHIAGNGVGNHAQPPDFELAHASMVAWVRGPAVPMRAMQGRSGRQPQARSEAAQRRCFQRDRSSIDLCEIADDRKAQPRARRSFIRSHPALQDGLAHPLCQPVPVIVNSDLHGVAGPPGVHGQVRASPFARVVEEVARASRRGLPVGRAQTDPAAPGRRWRSRDPRRDGAARVRVHLPIP